MRQILSIALIFYTATSLYAEQTPTSPVEYFWSGAVTPTFAKVNAKISAEHDSVRLIFSQQADLSEPRYSSPATVNAQHGNVVALSMGGLKPDTRYYYGFSIDGDEYTGQPGTFRTFPEGPASFVFAFGSCAEGAGQNHPVFTTIRNKNPLFFIHAGDLHYADIDVNDAELYRAAYARALTAPRQAALYRDVPIAYMWDDHDFGPNNSSSDAPGRLAARLTYQEQVPHYPLPAGKGDVPVYQAFSVGQVRFILTDSRSARTPYREKDGRGKTMLGKKQKQWFKEELLNARGRFPLIIWVNTLPWIGTSSDGWGKYATERREIANFIKANNIRGLAMLSGDAHMIAIDDGSNSDYADGGGAGFPVMHAGSLGGGKSIKGGPYSHGAVKGSGQFGWVEVTDTGADIQVHWSGRDADDDEVMGYQFAVEVD